jgi:hypothetical protein
MRGLADWFLWKLLVSFLNWVREDVSKVCTDWYVAADVCLLQRLMLLVNSADG